MGRRRRHRGRLRALSNGIGDVLAAHGSGRTTSSFVLGPDVVAAVDCPVILAGATMAAALALRPTPCAGDHVELIAWKDYRLIRAQCDCLPAGNVSSAITDLIHVAEFVPGIVRDAIAALEILGRRVVRDGGGDA